MGVEPHLFSQQVSCGDSLLYISSDALLSWSSEAQGTYKMFPVMPGKSFTSLHGSETCAASATAPH